MRISDWSSDVCSSDLFAQFFALGFGNTVAKDLYGALLRRDLARGGAQQRSLARPGAAHHGNDLAPDRKSVVWGKSVSVRVDLGGRRIIKKKHTIISYCVTVTSRI